MISNKKKIEYFFYFLSNILCFYQLYDLNETYFNYEVNTYTNLLKPEIIRIPKIIFCDDFSNHLKKEKKLFITKICREI